MTSTKTKYLEDRIRDGYTSEDVRMWQMLCEQAKTEVGASIHHMWTIIDIAKHTHSDVLDVIKCGRTVSEQKNVNEKFIGSLLLAVSEDEPFLECDEELSASGSYEENLDSAEQGEPVVDDEAADDDASTEPAGKLPPRRLLKRKQEIPAPFDFTEHPGHDIPG